MSNTDVPDWTNPIALITNLSALTDLPDWSIGVAAAPNTNTVIGGGGFGVYGDGSDGAQTLNGTNTFSWATLAGSTYTLSRDVFLGTSTISVGVTVNPNGFRFFCSGTLTNNGTIASNGNNASFQTGGSSLFNHGSINGAASGSQGGNGTSNSAGGAGTNAPANGYGGAAGGGGAGVSLAGGLGGTAAAFNAAIGQPRAVPWAVMGQSIANTSGSGGQVYAGGAGGGAGGGTTGQPGGGGGSGGPILIVSAMQFAGTGAIQCRGGNGANSGTPANTGGGGGGGGGLCIVISSSVSGGAISGQTVDANGGQPGAGGSGGHPGVAGSNGTVILLTN